MTQPARILINDQDSPTGLKTSQAFCQKPLHIRNVVKDVQHSKKPNGVIRKRHLTGIEDQIDGLIRKHVSGHQLRDNLLRKPASRSQFNGQSFIRATRQHRLIMLIDLTIPKIETLLPANNASQLRAAAGIIKTVIIKTVIIKTVIIKTVIIKTVIIKAAH
jgi:hypothetical protein